jgi:hypothetical protein
VDIIHEDQLWDLSAYKMIVLPTSYAISPGLAKRLETYVAEGGLLISDPYFGMYDECFRLSYEVPGYGFERVFGCRQDDMGVRGGVTLADATDASKTYRLDGNYHTETYRDIEGEVLYTYENGQPAVIGNRYGKGYAVMSGVNLGLPYSNRTLIADDIISRDKANTSTAAKEIIMRLCREAGVKGNICSCPGLKASLLSAEAGTGVILINSNSAEATGTVKLDANYTKLISLLGNATASVEGDVLTVTLPARESAVLRLEK